MTVSRVQPLIAVIGATGTGKSALAVRLAEELTERGYSAEIISADAMQLYRGMDIGTAKITTEEQRGIRHHMLDVLKPFEEATVAGYQRHARRTVEAIESRGAVPIIAGGSGLYVNAVLYDFQFPGSDSDVRRTLNEKLELTGLDSLVNELLSRDPAAATTVDLKNSRRVVRALEVLTVTGKPMAAQLPSDPIPVRDTMVIDVHEERSALVERLDWRVTQMWRAGLVQETETLIQHGIRTGPTASRAIGYMQALAQLDGDLAESEAIELTQKLTRRYARRQVSWFKRLPDRLTVTSDESTREETVRRLINDWESRPDSPIE
ncbi:MAG: tRNA (adenosine(37)-N6)-dimethylallyltransferase MiaA [Canibacter sp.]